MKWNSDSATLLSMILEGLKRVVVVSCPVLLQHKSSQNMHAYLSYNVHL